jgi:hypothetical protein
MVEGCQGGANAGTSARMSLPAGVIEFLLEVVQLYIGEICSER